MTDLETRYHETWLGMVQPVEGLVFSVPVLAEAGVMDRRPPHAHEPFFAALHDVAGRRRVKDLRAFLRDVLGFGDDDLVDGDALPPTLTHWVPEGRQRLAPTLVVRAPAAASDSGDSSGSSDSSDSSDSPDSPESGGLRAADVALVVWQLPDGLDFDRGETVTGPWEYPPQHKLDRLLRATRVPVGLLCNGDAFRLVFAPHGESTGALTFRVADLAETGGRPILDAFLSLLSSSRFFAVAADRTLRALLEQSRKRQANVTNALADQVFEALDLLLQGFAAAAERDGTTSLRDALADESSTAGVPGEHVYGGLLTALLRLVFLLYAEDRDLMPTGHPLYARHLSVLSLFDQLQQDAGAYPDTMGRRFGAWPRLLALFRAVYEGAGPGDDTQGDAVVAGALRMPARRGKLFDPNGYPFLEGWAQGGAAPHAPDDRAQVRVPGVDDGTVHQILERLLILDGARLSYRALDVEQIGSVYEALMGYRVLRLESPAVCLRDSGVWLETARVLQTPPNRREALVVDETGLAKGRVAKVAEQLKRAESSDDVLLALESLRKSPKSIPVRPAGALVLQPGAERRRTSSHYTPRSLSAPIVEKTLRPLLATMAAGGKEPTADELLELKVCDPAMGSGAFLVEACRFLADEIVKAWTRQGLVAGIERNHGDPVTHARRLVAQRCLYGVDKNPYAVTLARLSLWLVSFAKDEPFTFVDHALRWGDSLVGLSLEQLRRFHWGEGSAQADFVVDIVTRDLDEAMVHRQRILQLARMPGVNNARLKEDFLRDADDAVRNARLVADVLVGAFFAHEKDKDREKERTRRLSAAQQWVSSRQPPTDELLGWQREMHAVTPPFHWPIEFPEVFYAGRPDPLDGQHTNRVAWMDAFVGNPPFVGGSSISSNNGNAYLGWLLLQPQTHGNADISAHFFRRAWDLLGEHGTFGLIATNTIAQGDTRSTGLQFIVEDGGVIIDATRSVPWPGDAAVAVSVVHMVKGHVGQHIPARVLDDMPASAINSRLRAKTERPDPVVLAANAEKSFQGSKIYGQGFVLTPEERESLVAKDAKNAERIFPYLGGDEVNSSSTEDFDRYVINFGDMTLEEAERWPDLISIVREKVKPEREQLTENSIGLQRKRNWWKYGSPASALYTAIRPLRRCLVVCIHSKHLIFSFKGTGSIFSHALYAFRFDNDAQFAVMQSRVHEPWARLLSSTIGEAAIRYAPSDCFETFPFPRADQLAPGGDVDDAGEKLYAARAALMVERQQGLTTTYNQLKDPGCTDAAILSLRALHEQMDRAVLDAYGWTDVAVPPYCPRTPAEEQALSAFEDDVIDRLFALNAERAKEESLLGRSSAGPAKKAAKAAAGDDGAATTKKKPGRKKKTEPDQGGLF